MLQVIFSLVRLIFLEILFTVPLGILLSMESNDLIRVSCLFISGSVAMFLESSYSKKKFDIKLLHRTQCFSGKDMVLYIWLGIGFNLFNNWIYKWSIVNHYILERQNSNQLYKEYTWISIFVFVFMAGIVGPIAEEVYFRGILHNVLKRKYGIFLTSIIISAFWAAHHSEWFMYLYVFPMGVVMSYLYYKKNNILIPITIHISNNLFAYIRLAFWDKGVFPHMVKIGIAMLAVGGVIIYQQTLKEPDHKKSNVF